MHDSSAALLVKFRDGYLSRDPERRIADVGAFDENETYKRHLEGFGAYVGIDMRPCKNVSVVHTQEYGWWWEVLKTEHAFDVTISGQTLEHVRAPWRWIVDLKNITRPGGLIWICAPNTWDYHEVPIDCWRIWPEGMKALFDEAGLEVVEVGREGCDTFGIARKPK
jgi:SAM-dependent methyltransferase